MAFREKESAVLDIGSGHLSLMVASKTMGDYCRVTFDYSVPYEGILNGEFVDIDSTKNAFKLLFQRLKEKHGKIRTLYVGIPAEFSVCRVINTKLDQIKHKKVEDIDVDTLVLSSNPFKQDLDMELICSNPIYFVIDNDEEKYIDPLGKATKGLESRISYIAGSRATLDLIKRILKDNGVNDVKFLSSPRSEALGLFNTATRDKGVLLVDCGYKSTTLVVNSCDGLECMFSFSVGRYHINNWIAEGLGILPDESRILLEKVDLSFMPKDETYTVNVDGRLKSFSCKEVKDMTIECIGIICAYIKKCIETIGDTRIKNMSIHLTGSGLDFRGIEGCIANMLGKPIIKVYPTFESNFKKASYSKIMGLIYCAIK